jgi:hypothetical protein
MSGMGRIRPVTAPDGFSTWQPAMLDRTAGFGQNPTSDMQLSAPMQVVRHTTAPHNG